MRRVLMAILGAFGVVALLGATALAAPEEADHPPRPRDSEIEFHMEQLDEALAWRIGSWTQAIQRRDAAIAAAHRAKEQRVIAASTNRPAVPHNPAPIAGGVWAALRNCESGGNYAINTGNGFYGAYQFTFSTWNSMNTGYAYAHLAPPAVQDDAAQRLQARAGWGQWPHCADTLGLI